MNRICFTTFAAASLLASVLMAGCGASPAIVSSAVSASTASASGVLSGKLYGGPNPVVGATVTLYSTGSAYGAGATTITTATTDGSGFFNLTLPTATAVCTPGQYLYVTSYAGNTGANANNVNSLLMAALGSCAANYTITGTGPYANTYIGPQVWINEITTAAAAYALSGFMTTTGSVVNVGAPAANTETASGSTSTPSAAGLAHAFANALNLVNISSGQPYAYFANRASGGVVPDGEIFLLGNILQACVNSNGVTGTNNATANDGTPCGKLFSLTTPPTTGSVSATTVLGAMLNLAHYPNPSLNTWSADCTAAGSGTKTATSCLFGLAPSLSAGYAGAMTSAPPDWALAIVYPQGYAASACATGSTCSGINYPYNVALDYADDVFVLNADASTPTYTSLTGLANDGGILFTTANDSTNKLIKYLGTDTAGHVFGSNADVTSGHDVLNIYNSSNGAAYTAVTLNTSSPVVTLVDPYNNVFLHSSASGGNTRKLTYNGNSASPSYTISSVTNVTGDVGVLEMAWDANLDIVYFGASTTAPPVYIQPNIGTVASPSYSAPSSSTTFISAATTGSTSNAFGMALDSNNNIFTIASSGITKTTINNFGQGATTTLTAGSAAAIPPPYNSTLYNRYMAIDGNNVAFSGDNANGSAVTGLDVYDTVNRIALGTYKGCYVISGACGTASNTVPVWGARGEAIDSAGDVWVAAATTRALTEFIGVAAPTWPGKSMAKFGRPQ